MQVSATQDCSRCGTPLPVADGYVTWCHECGWNLRPVEQDGTAQGRLHRLYDAAGRRVGNRMASQLRSADRLLPSWTPAKVAAHGIAFGVYGFTAALFAGGLWLAAGAFPNPAALVAAALMLGAAILMRPRFGRPSAGGAVDRSSAPRLLALIDEVASALGTPPVHIVQIDEEYNASWAVVGLRRRRVLRLGLPLLAVLDPQERVAVIAHELAHGRNGDARRGFFVGSAVRGLGELYGVVRPEGRIDYDSYFGIFERIVNVILYVVSRPAMWLLLVELHLLLRDSQRAEYLADALAAEAAGTRAVVGLGEKTLLEPTFRAAVHHAAHARNGGSADVFADFAAAVAAMPEHERERRRRVAALEGARLDDTHPPTAMRIELLESRPRHEPAVVLDDEGSKAIDAELAARRADFQRELVEDYRDSLYA